MAQVGQTGFRGFTNAGAALTHRHDFLVNGKAVINPTVNYVPFLYAVTTKLTYRF